VALRGEFELLCVRNPAAWCRPAGGGETVDEAVADESPADDPEVDDVDEEADDEGSLV